MTNQPLPLESANAVAYAWQQLAYRAGVAATDSDISDFESLGVSVHYADPEKVVHNGKAIIISPCKPSDWVGLLETQPDSLSWLSASNLLPDDHSPGELQRLPVLFWGKGVAKISGPVFEIDSRNRLVCHVDLIATTLFMLTRWEETITLHRDERGRFPSWASVASRQKFLHMPIVDLWAMVLKKWLMRLLPEWRPITRSFDVLLSHDMDELIKYSTIQSGIHGIASAIFRRRSVHDALTALKATINWRHDPFYQGIQKLMNISETYAFKSVFNFMTSSRGSLDAGYDITQEPYLSILSEVQRRGHEIGFHPGYQAFSKEDLLRNEKYALDKILGRKNYGCRQHYLLFQVPDTWRKFNNLELRYDNSLTYEDQAGFRCGTCHPYRVFDMEQRKTLQLVEIPLIVMEKTIFSHKRLNLSPEEGFRKIMSLARSCRAVGGVFTMLWHNSTFFGDDLKWSWVYENLIEALSKLSQSPQHTGDGNRLGHEPGYLNY